MTPINSSITAIDSRERRVLWLRATLRDRRVVLAAILLLALAIRLFYVVEIRPARLAVQPEENDGYEVLARDWVEQPGKLLGLEAGYNISRMPLYPLFLAGVFGLGGDESTARVAQALVDTFTALLIYLLAFRTFGSPLTAGLAGLAYALYPPMIRLTGVLATETLYVFLVVLFLLLLQLFAARPAFMRRALLAGLGLGLVVATRVDALYFALAILGYLAIRSRGDYQSLARGSLPFLLGIALILLPWMGRNYLSMGRFELGMSQPWAAAWANIFIDPWSSYQRDRWGEILVPELQKLQEKYGNYGESQAIYRKEFSQYLLQHPWEYGVKVLKRFFAYWFIETKIWWTLFNLAMQTPILLAAAYGVIRARGRNRAPLSALLLWVLYLNVMFALSSAEIRYAMGAMPVVLVLAASGVVHLLLQWQRPVRLPSPIGPRNAP